MPVVLALWLGYYLGHRDGVQQERRAWLATEQTSPNASGGFRAACHPNLTIDPHLLHKSPLRRDNNCQVGAGAGESARPPEHPRQMNLRRLNQRIEPMRGTAIRFVVHSATYGALPLMAHPQRKGSEPDCTNWRASVSIGYEHETSLEGCSAVTRSSDPVLRLLRLRANPPGEDQSQGATHRFGQRCPSRRHEYGFDQHRSPAVQHFAERGKMRQLVPPSERGMHAAPGWRPTTNASPFGPAVIVAGGDRRPAPLAGRGP